MTHLNVLLDQLESKIPFQETSNLDVSKGNVGWHIEHCLLTLDGVTKFLVQSDPSNYSWSFNWIRIIVFLRKKIPRGRARAPKIVQPQENLNQEGLLNHLSQTRNAIKGLASVSKNHYFKHPYFGNLKLEQTINFLEIHTQHHLAIMDDILKKQV